MPEPLNPLVSVLIVNFNVKELLLQCLEALYTNTDVPIEVVVVDNASVDGSSDAVAEHFPDVKLVRSAKNHGFGRANNVGLELCNGRFVLLLNPDVTVDPGCVGRLADFLLTRQDAAAVGPQLRFPNGDVDPDGRRAFPVPSNLFYRTVGLSRLFPRHPVFGRHNMGHLPDTDVHEMDAGTAACLMFRKTAIDRVGFFDPRYFMFGEDLDLCYRLKLGGWKIFYTPAATAVHHKGAAVSQSHGRMLFQKHRAMWAYHSKHHADDLSAFGNGLVWAAIWGRWAARAAVAAGSAAGSAARSTRQKPPLEEPPPEAS